MSLKDKAKELDSKMDKTIASGKKKGKSFLRKLFIFLLLTGLLALAAYVAGGTLFSYSSGSRAGDLIKISKKGIVFKTYEGQLKLGGIDISGADEGTISDTWEFSVADKEIVEQLKNLQGQEVILEYEEKFYTLMWRGDTKYFITDVKKVKQPTR